MRDPCITNSMKIDINIWLMMIFSLHGMFSVDGVSNSNVYEATELIFVNCGSSSSVQVAHRTWSADINSEQFSLFENHQNNHPLSSTAHTSQLNIPSSVDQVPYATARLSLSEFTYSFVVTDGPKFVRLHFYPASYSNFDRSSSLFSVKSGPFTLLKDFNASQTADYDDDSRVIVFREYCIYVQPGDKRLNITFIPTHPNAYAFINGIEVVSMPNYLYYTNPDTPDFDLAFVGHENSKYQIKDTIALETLYRIAVGVDSIPAEEDTGMFRYWNDDQQYVEQVHSRSLPNSHGEQKLKYTMIPNYTAPDQVYRYGRSYGMNEISITYNLTWEFEVDSGFTYMVRLHFCELDPNIHTPNDRVFQIFIADDCAERHADVVQWAEDNLTPYYKDYAVSKFSNEQNLKKLNLSIKLQPYPDARVSGFNDVILNGIEVFKISDNGNLGGPNPDPRVSTSLEPSVPLINNSKNPKTTKIISIVVGVASGFMILSLVLLIYWRRKTRAPNSTATSKTSMSTHKSSSLPPDLCRCFSIVEIRAATNNFDDTFIVGTGGFGNVYKGYIDDGTIPVAIKRLKPGSQQGAQEFQTEIEMLSQLRHIHLVSLIGYCNDGDEMILVYEFMARGTLRDHLYCSDYNEPLSWKQRLRMCLGAARGLHYLHTGTNHNIIHRDVKSTNILVDEKWVAKVSDFGLSKVGPTGM